MIDLILFVGIFCFTSIGIYIWISRHSLFPNSFRVDSFGNQIEIEPNLSYLIPQHTLWTSEQKTIRKSKGKRKQYIPKYIKHSYNFLGKDFKCRELKLKGE